MLGRRPRIFTDMGNGLTGWVKVGTPPARGVHAASHLYFHDHMEAA